MKEFVIFTKSTTVVNNLWRGSESNITLTGSNLSSLKSDVYTKHTFLTYEEALEYAMTLDYGVTIYESVAQTKIQHEVTLIGKNTNSTARKQA